MKKAKHIIILLFFSTVFLQKINAQKVINKEDSLQCENLNAATIQYYKNDKIDSALLNAKYAVNYSKKVVGKEHRIYIMSLYNLIFLYNYMDYYNDAELLSKEILTIGKKILGREHPNYATSLNNLAELYYDIGNYAAAEPLYKEALAIRKKVLGREHPDYATSLNNLGLLYHDIGNYTIAEPLLKESLVIRKKILGTEHPDYATSLNNLGLLYQGMGNYTAAEPLYKEALIIRKKILGTEHQDYAASLSNMALLYHDLSNYTAAEPLYKEALAIYEKVLGTEQPDYATILSNLALLYHDLGNYTAAEPLYKEALTIRKKVLGIEHLDYATSLNNLAVLYYDMGNYIAAEPLYKEALTIRKKELGAEHPDYATIVNNLAELYKVMGNYTAAEPLYKEALAIRKKILGTEHPDYAVSLNNLASLYHAMGNYTAAEPLYKKALFFYKKALGIEHANYAISLNNLALLYNVTGNYAAAESLYKEALAIRKKVLGMEHPDYAASLSNLVGLYYFFNKYSKWKNIIHTAIQTENNNQQVLLKNFSEAEKEIYLNENNSNRQVFLSMLHYYHYSQTNFFYQSTTATQGWLLQGKQLLNIYANHSTDITVKTLLTNWQHTNILYTKTIQLTKNKQHQYGLNADSLKEQVQNIEKQLTAAIPALQNVLKNKGYTAKEITPKLNNNEAVVQWVSFKYQAPKQWTDTIFYAAFIITKTDTTPTFITVFTEKQLQNLLQNYHGISGRSSIIKNANTKAIATDFALYNLIWKPLLPYLSNITTVYNLPSGLLHKVSFATLTDTANGKSLIDIYNLHQLLSINELVAPLSGSTPNKTIALIGAANYDAIVASNNNTNSATIQPMYRNATNTDNKNIRFNYLQGTKTEIETVNNQTKNTTWKVQTYTDTIATEDNLKQLSGSNAPHILHIATHGFYFPPKKEKLSTNNLFAEDKNAPKDFPLLRSGIVLSGANNYWGKDTLLEGKEDGIVTAQEISNMNLLNTDLVVLSACQTALGDINGSEGVYGLQRAFKMAGVKKLLISLWEVPDAETAELMQLFYGNIFKGDSYYTAFKKAQLALKIKYKDPTKWAGFVLYGE